MQRWLSVIGLGEDGMAGLSAAACQALEEAALIFGGARHLALLPEMRGEKHPWPSPLEKAYPAIVQARGRKVAVLASGDPFYHGIGAVLSTLIEPEEMQVFAAPSAYALAAARLGWAGQDCIRLSLHGRPLARLIPHLQPGAKILALSTDGTTPRQVAEIMTARGFGASSLTVLERMGGPHEKIRRCRAEAFDLTAIDPLNTLAIAVVGGAHARPIFRAPGLPDEWFENDGQITRREVRALTLSALAPFHGGLLWDVGAGSGAVGIEWMLADPSCRAIAIESRPERAERIGRNAQALGVPDLRVVVGKAPAAFAALPRPDAIFIGGGGREDVMTMAVSALKPGGRLVVNAVTLETEALLTAFYTRYGGVVLTLAFARAESLGAFHGLRPGMAVRQWSWQKPFAEEG